MKQILVSSSLVLLLNVINPSYGSAQKLSAVPVDLEIPISPTPVKANGNVHLLYELHITNFRAKTLELTRVEVLSDDAKPQSLVSYENAELTSRLARPGGPPDLPNNRVIGGGMRAVLFLEIIIDSEARVPSGLRHGLIFRSTNPDRMSEDSVVEGARVVVHRDAPLVIGPPLRGEGWVALDGLSNTGVHRRTIVVVNGKARIAQRFATDWTRIGADGQAFRGDPSKNENWSAYGAEVLAVASGTVVDLKDGIPENDPTADKKAVEITLETVGGNYIILDLGNGHFAFYAHLQPKSMRVKVGDRVRPGQVLALLGNSGNADAPHLHFHISNGNSPLAAEGLPYVFASFEVEGILPSKKVLVNGKGWRPSSSTGDKRRMEIPVENSVIRFP